MLDYFKSAKLNNCTVDELKLWFSKHPSSGKIIISICDICNLERRGSFNQYRDLCPKCSVRTLEARKANSSRQIEWYENNSKARKDASKRTTDHFKNQTNRDEMSEIIKNSEAAKINSKNQKGGNDICEHHYIYDHSDISKYTMKITRSRHGRLHKNMQISKIKVPHINITEENKDIFER